MYIIKIEIARQKCAVYREVHKKKTGAKRKFLFAPNVSGATWSSAAPFHAGLPAPPISGGYKAADPASVHKGRRCPIQIRPPDTFSFCMCHRRSASRRAGPNVT